MDFETLESCERIAIEIRSSVLKYVMYMGHPTDTVGAKSMSTIEILEKIPPLQRSVVLEATPTN